ncbi:hypothetical protein BD770DRAFT_426421 [Pilaira anomala]|nr:hypothetical protein BD770DRAFT_426421 [Pilaira anomala]
MAVIFICGNSLLNLVAILAKNSNTSGLKCVQNGIHELLHWLRDRLLIRAGLSRSSLVILLLVLALVSGIYIYYGLSIGSSIAIDIEIGWKYMFRFGINDSSKKKLL